MRRRAEVLLLLASPARHTSYTYCHHVPCALAVPDDRCATLACRCPRASGTPQPGAMDPMAEQVASLPLVRKSESPLHLNSLFFFPNCNAPCDFLPRNVHVTPCHPRPRFADVLPEYHLHLLTLFHIFLSYPSAVAVLPSSYAPVGSSFSRYLQCTLLLALKMGGPVFWHCAPPPGHGMNTT